MASKKKLNKGEQRRIRTQQIVLSIIGVLVILSMLLALTVKY